MRFLAAFAAALLVAAPAAAQDAQDAAPSVRVAFHTDGTVTVSARNVTTRDILAEWARQCRCYVVNADRLVGSPLAVPLLFERAPQAVVLQSLLRQAAGYVLTPRRAGYDGPSNYETIYILATSAATAAPSFGATAPSFQPVSVPTTGSPDDEIPAVTPVVPPALDPTRGAAQPDNNSNTNNRVDTGVIPGMTVPAVRIVPVWPSTPSGQGSTPAAPVTQPGQVTPGPAAPGTAPATLPGTTPGR